MLEAQLDLTGPVPSAANGLKDLANLFEFAEQAESTYLDLWSVDSFLNMLKSN